MAEEQLQELFRGAVFTDYDDSDSLEQPDELRSFLAYSGTGRLYVATDDGKIKWADVRQQLLAEVTEEDTGAASSAPRSSSAPRIVQPTPELQLTPQHFVLSRGSSYAAVAGPTLQDPEIYQVSVLDLAAARPTLRTLPRSSPAATAATATTPGPSSSGPSNARPVQQPDAVCEATALDADLFSSRPGLRVLQLGWHPASEGHLAVLTSDNTWRLYNTQRPELAEQTFELTGLRSRRGLGLGLDAAAGPSSSPGGVAAGNSGSISSSSSSSRAAVAFAWGPPSGWEQFSVLFLTSSGEVFSLCPVLPFGCHLPAAALDDLLAAAAVGAGEEAEQGANTEAWLQQAFRPVAPPAVAAAAAAAASPAFASGMVQSVPHALDEHVPALAGPLPVATTTGEQFSLTELSGSGSDSAQALLVSRYGGTCTAVVIATAAGFVGAHLLAGELQPVWAESTPQCMLDSCSGNEELQAVRSQVPLVPALRAAPLLLLDVVELGLSLSSSAAAADDGIDSSSTASSSTVQLLQDPAAAEGMYCLHPSAAFALRLPWLPVLADALGGAANGGRSGRLPAVLPAPEVQPLLECGPPSASSSSGFGFGAAAAAGKGKGGTAAGILGGTAVGDPLAGSALVVATPDGSPRVLRPKRAAAGAAALPGAQALSGAAASAAALGRGGSSAGVDREVQQQIERTYGEILKGPKPAALPRPPEGAKAGAGNPEGQRLLSQSIAALRASHVEFQHQAHHDIKQRLAQLQAEAEQQQARAASLQQLADSAESGAEHLQRRVQQAAAVQANLAARLKLLADLHWSLPRPPSLAEQRFQLEELPAMEAAARQLEADVKSLAGRGAALARRLRSLDDAAAAAAAGKSPSAAAAAAAGGVSSATPPPAQLRKLREVVAGQEALITASMQRLSVLEGALMQHAEASGLPLPM